jgi:hypothetical protein
MGRKGPELTRDHADRIVKKLKAEVDKTQRNHDIATVYHEGAAVLTFNLRRSSRKDTGHGHLTEDLFLPVFQVKRLANCPMSVEEWVLRMKEKGVIEGQEKS